MADKKRKPTSMDGMEKKALPEEAGLNDIKGIEEEASSEPAIMEQVVTEEESQTPNEQNAEDDDPFADIRRSLMEEESAKREKKNSGILHRVTGLLKGARRKTAPLQEEEARAEEQAESALVVHDSAMPVPAEENPPVVETGETSKQEAEEELLAVLFPPVESVEETVEERVDELRSELLEHPEPLEADPEPEHHIEEIKSSEVLRAHPEQKAAVTDFESMRGVALEGYDETTVEPEVKPAVSGKRKLRMVFKTLKPIDRVMIFGALFLIFMAAVATLGLRVFNSLQPADITPAEPTQDLPFPVRVTLPGGWEFKLARGRVVDGRWSPSGAEWLEGTEVCRWVALPWSLQLEAVVRTLKLEDPIDLTMSNADQIKYKVQSIQNVPVDEIDSLVGKNMCLLLILVNEDSDTRWVVTATP